MNNSHPLNPRGEPAHLREGALSLPLADLLAAAEFLPPKPRENREHFDGVLIEYQPGGPAILAAGDGHVIGVRRADCASTERGALMVPRALIKRMRKAAGARGVNALASLSAGSESITLGAAYGSVTAPRMVPPLGLVDWRDLFPRNYSAWPSTQQVNPVLLARVQAAAGQPVFVRGNKHGAFVHTADMHVLAVVGGMRDMEELPGIPHWVHRRWAPAPAGVASESAA